MIFHDVPFHLGDARKLRCLNHQLHSLKLTFSRLKMDRSEDETAFWDGLLVQGQTVSFREGK